MISDRVQKRYSQLLLQCRDLPNAVFLAKIVASWLLGESSLPQRMGLSRKNFPLMMRHYFPEVSVHEEAFSGRIYSEDYAPELEELVDLFLAHRADRDISEEYLAQIMAMGCQADEHLWHDLGFWCRAELSAMIKHNFPTLFAKNVKNMKWKKFFYKQMCLDLDATYQCRVPSCSVCVDYQECYPSVEELQDEFDKGTIK